MPADAEEIAFPDGFVWGVATAAYQIEGSVDADGRGVSIWDTFSHTPGRTANGDTGDVACDHYRLVDSDLDLIASLGPVSYRFSVAWPRVQPDGKGPANRAGLDFYRRLVDGLLHRGVEPTVTLYHWDLPQPLEDAGGWVARDTAERFGEMASLVGEALDGVARWITLNEPWCSAWHGYGNGVHAPGTVDSGAALAASHHLLLGHARAAAALRGARRSPVGVTLNLAPVRPASDHPLDRAAADVVDGYCNRLYLDPLLLGRYPEDLTSRWAALSPGFSVVEAGDLAAISAPLDFLGINYYSRAVVSDASRVVEARRAGYATRGSATEPALRAEGIARVVHAEAARTEMGWSIDPDGLTELLQRVSSDYRLPPVYVTENGAAFCDYVDPDGNVKDPDRIRYLDGHLRAAARAIEAGVDLRGYFCWSLMDNFEWSLGYAKRFGLVWVDYPSGQRTPKASFGWYRDVVAANRLPPPAA